MGLTLILVSPSFAATIVIPVNTPDESSTKQDATSPDAAGAEETDASESTTTDSAGESALQDESSTAGTSDASPDSGSEARPSGFLQQVNQALEPVDAFFGKVNGVLESVIFYPIPLVEGRSVPAGVAWLVIAALFLTFRMNFINLRGFVHAIKVTAGRYDDPSDAGEVSHFQALTAALSATVGLGNIAGVAVAVGLGGPGATFWMIVAGFLGMSSKFVECTLGQMYRQVRPDGRIMGGAMFYLTHGLQEIGLGGLGKALGLLFAVLCIGGSFAGGNAFQVNQSLGAVGQTVGFVKEFPWVYGLVMSVLAGVVIIGGIRRIASTAEKIVPFMCGVYVLACLAILFRNLGQIPTAFGTIVSSAFSMEAGWGGLVGVLIQGFKRAAFSNEAGVGSAAIAHSAARTDYAVREGIVSLLEPFIDTVVVCTMTALVIVITGAYDYQNPNFDPEMKANYTFADDGSVSGIQGAALTSVAMDKQIPYFRYVLAVATALFAFSTMISWSYYGERCWAYLFGDNASMSYKVVFLIFSFLGSVISAPNVLDFGDLMIFGMAIPNVLGLFLLSGKVRGKLDDYWRLLKSGELDREAEAYRKK
ncbi:MAG: alanine:cation symporter family protein [Planctomycetaceae bacterium]|nr:alanine:cation symporter family protein [Planctomycetaceae bacterium]